jgi:hypothetical protein
VFGTFLRLGIQGVDQKAHEGGPFRRIEGS